MSSSPARVILLVVLVLVGPGAGRAAGPLIVNGAGTPLVWTENPVPYNPDQGTLGTLSNASAVASVGSNFAVWTNVATATLSFVNAGALPVDVTAANFNSYYADCGDGLSPIIFDTNGSITDSVFGAGASNSILGFAGPECVTVVPAVITQGIAVLNGKFIDGVSTPSNPEISLAAFNAVFVHEFGHYVNLDHSQVNLTEAFDGNSSNDAAIATMFPFLVAGAEGSTLHLDDQVSVSTLYPEPTFATGFGKLTGSVFRSDGTTRFQGAYVVARKIGDPRLTAVGVASGAHYFPGSPGGPPPVSLQGLHEMPGLPAGSYTVEVEAIYPAFDGGSSVGPFDTPVALPGPPEFYNGGSEAGSNPPDDPAAFVSLAVAAGATQSGINIVLNSFAPPPNDNCTAPTTIPSLPYTHTVNTTGATTAVSDPLQSCTVGGPQQNSSSVWYAFTAATDLAVVADTFGSNYDTVLTAHTGACGALTEIACNDDAVQFQSEIGFSMNAGQTVLLEVTAFSSDGGGNLVLNVRAVLGCGTTPETGCRQPTKPEGALLKLSRGSSEARDALVWKWVTGQATVKDDFGQPTSTTDYALCLYDEVGGVLTRKLAAAAPAGNLCGSRPCWRETASGFRYSDRERTPHGIQRIVLKEGGDGQAKITLRARGELLNPPLPLLQQNRVIVQLRNGASECWEVEYNGPAQTNEPDRFIDRGG